MTACSATNPKKCVPCEGLDSSDKLTTDQVKDRLEKSLPLWTLLQQDDEAPPKLSRSFVAKNFQAALNAINSMGAIAEEENHHPDFHLTAYRNVQIDIFTHSLDGITDNDLTLASLLDNVPVEYSPKWLRAHPGTQSSSSSLPDTPKAETK